MSGDGDDRRKGQVRVLEPGCQVSRADGLGHADARAIGGARVAVGHVCCGLLTVGHDALDTHPVHLDHGLSDYRRHEEYVTHAVALEGLGKKTATRHHRHIVTSR